MLSDWLAAAQGRSGLTLPGFESLPHHLLACGTWGKFLDVFMLGFLHL